MLWASMVRESLGKPKRKNTQSKVTEEDKSGTSNGKVNISLKFWNSDLFGNVRKTYLILT